MQGASHKGISDSAAGIPNNGNDHYTVGTLISGHRTIGCQGIYDDTREGASAATECGSR